MSRRQTPMSSSRSGEWSRISPEPGRSTTSISPSGAVRCTRCWRNGAGKSTLIRVICGASRPTAGAIFVGGQLVEFASPQQAQALGIAVVHQHFNLATQLSVAENLFLSRSLPRRAGIFVNWSETSAASRKVARARRAEHRPDDGSQPASPRRKRDGRDRQSDRQRCENHHSRRTHLGPTARGRSISVRAHAPARIRGPLVSLREPPAGGSVRDRGPGHCAARRKAGRRMGRERTCRVGRSSRRSSAQASPSSRTPPPRKSPSGAAILVAEDLAGGRVESLSFELRAGEILGSPACLEAAPKKRWICCSPAIPFGAGS